MRISMTINSRKQRHGVKTKKPFYTMHSDPEVEKTGINPFHLNRKHFFSNPIQG
jgi:hypothetical protein